MAHANNIKINHENLNYALILSVSPSIKIALTETYKDLSEGVPHWGGSDAEILLIDKLKGEEEIKIRVESSGQKLLVISIGKILNK